VSAGLTVQRDASPQELYVHLFVYLQLYIFFSFRYQATRAKKLQDKKMLRSSHTASVLDSKAGGGIQNRLIWVL
jgi:hypothetical protein